MTLHEAVKELNAMPVEDAKALLDTYPNIHNWPRFKTCPVAQHLSSRVGEPVNVFSFGLVEVDWTYGEREYVSRYIVSLMSAMDFKVRVTND
jgi:hypothetical protein